MESPRPGRVTLHRSSIIAAIPLGLSLNSPTVPELSPFFPTLSTVGAASCMLRIGNFLDFQRDAGCCFAASWCSWRNWIRNRQVAHCKSREVNQLTSRFCVGAEICEHCEQNLGDFVHGALLRSLHRKLSYDPRRISGHITHQRVRANAKYPLPNSLPEGA